MATSPRAFHHAPIVQPDEDEAQQETKSKTRTFLSAIGLSCLFRGRRTARRHLSAPYQSRGRMSRQANLSNGPALRAITIDDAQFTFSRNMLDSDDGMSSVYSSHYDGSERRNQYVLFLGSESSSSLRPRLQSGENEMPELHSLRPSLQQRELPVFFTPPPHEVLAVTPRSRKSMLMHTSPPDSPLGVFA